MPDMDATTTPTDKVNNLMEELSRFEGTKTLDDGYKLNMLVVDDEDIMRNLLTDVLESEGYKVNSFSRAEDALEQVKKKEADIIITDIKMRGMSGLDLLKEAKQIDSEIDVIVMTGYASIKTAVESMKLGAIDYLTKPLDIDQIRIIVNRTKEQRNLKKRAQESSFYKKLSQLDGLTELFNHRFFQQLLNIEIARADREKWPLSLIMLDIDDFKLFNDRNGHPMGDLALKKLSWVLQNNCRACDFAARYGGEEFAVIIPNADKKTASSMANRIRKVVEETRFDLDEILGHNSFTVSVGIAEYPKDAHDRTDLIEKTDRALYQAKNSGKNKVCLYNEG